MRKLEIAVASRDAADARSRSAAARRASEIDTASR
jgi:hypothetical protein